MLLYKVKRTLIGMCDTVDMEKEICSSLNSVQLINKCARQDAKALPDVALFRFEHKAEHVPLRVGLGTHSSALDSAYRGRA